MPQFRSLLTPDLRGWRMAGRGRFCVTEQGLFESEGGRGLLWYADEAFDDFILEVRWRATGPEDNSGVFLRAPPLADDPAPAIAQGYEVQIDDRGVDPDGGRLDSPLHRTGAIYKLAPAARLLSRPLGSWNEFRITARGDAIVVVLNGQEASRLEGATRNRRGHLALQCHHAGSRVQFEQVAIAALDGSGP
jgi:3-keto-disaccharide hydrolase